MSARDLAMRVGVCAAVTTAAVCVVMTAYCYLFPYRVINDDGLGVILINEWSGKWKRVENNNGGYGHDHMP